MISAVIITLNEEKKIVKSLKSLWGLVDEIIVVDSGSTDATLDTARKFGAEIYFRKFDNFSNQRNWALSKATGEWVLSVDADEEISPALASEIKKAIENEKFAGYLIPRRNFILGGEIKHSRWSPDKHIWLWKKELGRWEGLVHEEVMVKGKIGIIKNPKIHHSHQTVGDFIESNNLYSNLEAFDLYKHKINFSFSEMVWEAGSEFFLRYVYKRGFLDGIRGFALAYLMGIYKLMVWIKLWQLIEENK